MQRCPRCEREIPVGAGACPHCGGAGRPAACAVHGERIAVGHCLLCGRSLCNECRHGDRRTGRCAEHAGVPVIQGWAQIYTTNSDFEAQLLRENLRAEGIESQIFSQRDSVFAVEMGNLSLVRLLVPAGEYDRAREVIRSHMDDDGEVAFACPACGEPQEPDAPACAACGTALG